VSFKITAERKLSLDTSSSYKASDVEKLVEGTLPQRRVLDLAPGIGDVIGSDGKEHLTRIMEASLEY
jgi:hydroxyacid-oxoacid transhydrogenase